MASSEEDIYSRYYIFDVYFCFNFISITKLLHRMHIQFIAEKLHTFISIHKFSTTTFMTNIFVRTGKHKTKLTV
jgi:hypothetical protein